MSSANPNDTDALALLEDLTASDQDDQSRAVEAWRIIIHSCESSDEFAVCLDFAMEHGLYVTPFAPQLRGEQVDVVPPGYWTNPIDGSEMVWIPGGSFLFGTEPVSKHCDGFFLARYPVTNEQFRQFVRGDDGGPTEYSQGSPVGTESPPSPEFGRYLAHWPATHRLGEDLTQEQLRQPVTFVSLMDAYRYCDWAGLSLPNEYMWEKAARGTDGRLHPWGDDPPDYWAPGGWRWRGNLASGGLVAVGSYPEVRSPYGCEDLIGNVSEWCAPKDRPDAPQTADDRAGNEPSVRGSCYKRRGRTRMRSSHRRLLAPFRRNDWTGFRPAFIPGVLWSSSPAQ